MTRKTATTPEELVSLFGEFANAGDVEGLVSLYEADAVVAIGDPVATGAAAIRDFYTGLLAKRSSFPLVEARPALVSGDVAMTITPLPNGRCSLEVAHRQADGSWRWMIDQLKVDLGAPKV
jgi:ketosteroid isomerase-like protein